MITAAGAGIIAQQQIVKDRANRVIEAIANDIEKHAKLGCRELIVRADTIGKYFTLKERIFDDINLLWAGVRPLVEKRFEEVGFKLTIGSYGFTISW
jgi:hypothetical protein